MNFLIVTHVPHTVNQQGQIGAYSPYVREMNLWAKYTDEITIVAPASSGEFSAFDLAYQHSNVKLVKTPDLAFTSAGNIVKSAIKLPQILWIIFQQMKKADHIHLRTPGNMGLLGCFVQILFPGKKKTAKYAGNWDPAYKNPLSYSLQKKILNSTLLTKNIETLIYGTWPGITKNIKPFFTATYFSKEEERHQKDFSGSPAFIFCGVLDERKDPFFTYEIFKEIKKQLPGATIQFCGNGKLEHPLQEKVNADGNAGSVTINGAMTKDQLKLAYKASHFLLFFTKTSEGWPKAVAESLYWGVLPVTKPISVVSQMTGNGSRGLLFTKLDAVTIANEVVKLWGEKNKMAAMSADAMVWSRPYTLDRFENEISKLM